jgi:hypothetical protein
MRNHLSFSVFAPLAVALSATAAVACSSPRPTGPATFPADPYSTTPGDLGALVVAVRTSPQPPSRGTNDVELTVTSAASGAPVDGLTVDVEPWMPAMGHGTATPTVTANGSGVYLVSEVYLYMPGTWLLRTTFSGEVSDHVEPQLTVP